MAGNGYDYAYLKDTVGPTLTRALAELALKQPEDPVDFVGNYLLKHVANMKRQEEINEYNAQKKEWITKHEEAERMKELTKGITELKLKQESEDDVELKNKLKDMEDISEVYDTILQRILERTGASSVYIGRKVVDVDDVTKIHWFAATDKSKEMIDQGLAEEEGVTFEALKEVEDENAEPFEDGSLPPPHLPDYIHIENVIREPRMVFYGIPRLGAYLAKGIKYNQYLHDQIHQEVEPGVINSKVAWLVIGMGNMGQARSFTKKQIDIFQEWVNLLGECIETLEKRIYLEESAGKQAQSDEWVAVREKLKEKTDENEERIKAHVEALEEGKELKTAEIRLTFMTELLLHFIQDIEKSAQFQTPYELPVLYAIAAALHVLGTPTTTLFNPVTKLPDWKSIRPHLLQGHLQSKLEKFDPSCTTIEAKTFLEKTSLDTIEPINPIAACLFSWTQAAIQAADAIAEAALATEPTED